MHLRELFMSGLATGCLLLLTGCAPAAKSTNMVPGDLDASCEYLCTPTVFVEEVESYPESIKGSNILLKKVSMRSSAVTPRAFKEALLEAIDQSSLYTPQDGEQEEVLGGSIFCRKPCSYVHIELQ